MGVMDERIPGQPGSGNPLEGLLKILAMGMGKQSQPGVGMQSMPGNPGVVAPERVGTAPPNVVVSNSAPGGTGSPGLPAQNNAMSPAQAGGPAARGQVQGYQGPYSFGSKAAKSGAIVDSAIKGLHSFVMEEKQHKFEQEASQASVIALASIAKQKLQSGQQLTQQDTQAIEAAAKLEKKAGKLVEKAMTDPMSGAYVGMQRAYASYQQQETQRLTNEGMQQESALKAAQAKKAEAEAKFWENYKGQLEQQKLDAGKVKEQNKLVEQASLKGQHIEFDENGKAKARPFTQTEIDSDPMLKAAQQKEQAYTKAAVARVRQGDLRLAIESERTNLSKQRLALETQYKMALIDKIKSGADKYNAGELKTMSLATMGKNYLDEMKQIIQRRPDLFGPAGWGDNAYNVALGNKDKDAMRFATLADTAALPFAGVHNVRGLKLIKALQDSNSNLYQDPGVAMEKIDTESDAMQGAIDAVQQTHKLKPGAVATTGDKATSTGGVTIKRDAQGRIIGVE